MQILKKKIKKLSIHAGFKKLWNICHEKCVLFELKKLLPNKTEHTKAEQTQ